MKNISLTNDYNMRTLGYHTQRILGALVRNVNKELKKEGLDFQHTHFSILRILYETDVMSQSELSRILGRDPASISRTINQLEENGYLVRKALNGCKNGVSLTHKGRQIVPTLSEIASRITNQAFSGISDQERNQVFNILTRIYHNCL